MEGERVGVPLGEFLTEIYDGLGALGAEVGDGGELGGCGGVGVDAVG